MQVQGSDKAESVDSKTTLSLTKAKRTKTNAKARRVELDSNLYSAELQRFERSNRQCIRKDWEYPERGGRLTRIVDNLTKVCKFYIDKYVMRSHSPSNFF